MEAVCDQFPPKRFPFKLYNDTGFYQFLLSFSSSVRSAKTYSSFISFYVFFYFFLYLRRSYQGSLSAGYSFYNLPIIVFLFTPLSRVCAIKKTHGNSFSVATFLFSSDAVYLRLVSSSFSAQSNVSLFFECNICLFSDFYHVYFLFSLGVSSACEYFQPEFSRNKSERRKLNVPSFRIAGFY